MSFPRLGEHRFTLLFQLHVLIDLNILNFVDLITAAQVSVLLEPSEDCFPDPFKTRNCADIL